MSTKDDSILFGAKRAGITWLFEFYNRDIFNDVQAGAKRLGLSLAEFLCRLYPLLTGAPTLPEEPRKFNEEARKASVLKIQLIDCDNFTRRCLERQAKSNGCETIEEYITDAAHHMLETDESDSIIDARTGNVVLGKCLLPDLEGCKIDKDAPPREKDFPIHLRAVNRLPAGTIVEQCA